VDLNYQEAVWDFPTLLLRGEEGRVVVVVTMVVVLVLLPAGEDTTARRVVDASTKRIVFLSSLFLTPIPEYRS
jgi:hypothetical protein